MQLRQNQNMRSKRFGQASGVVYVLQCTIEHSVSSVLQSRK